MDFFSNTSLSWQTGTLVFRNQSFHEVKQQLEAQYGTEVPMYQWEQNAWHPHWLDLHNGERAIQDEIRLTLFLYYESDKDDLLVRGVQIDSQR